MLLLVGTYTAAGLTFWFPLLLTAKQLSNYNTKSTTTNSNSSSTFLLNYWVCYVFLLRLESLDFFKTISNAYWDLVFAAIKCWLFYYHGCLIVNYYYVESVLRSIFIRTDVRSSQSTFQVLELNLIDPLVNQFYLHNFLVNHLLQILARTKLAVFRSFAAYTVDIGKGISADPNTSFLQLSLDYLCFVDSTEALHQSFKRTRYWIANLFAVFALPAAEQKTKSPRRVVLDRSRRREALPNINESPKNVSMDQIMYSLQQLQRHESIMNELERERDRPEKVEWPERVERSEKIDRPERIDRIDRPERLDRPERIDRFDRPDAHRLDLERREVLRRQKEKEDSVTRSILRDFVQNLDHDQPPPPPLKSHPTSDLPAPALELHYTSSPEPGPAAMSTSSLKRRSNSVSNTLKPKLSTSPRARALSNALPAVQY